MGISGSRTAKWSRERTLASPPSEDPGLGRLVGFLRTGSEIPAWTGVTLADGTRVGRPIGLGGFCAVFEGTAPDRRSCAVKVLLPDLARHPDQRRRFAREARLLLARGIEGLPGGIAAGEHEGLPWVVMERVLGRTLADALREEGRFEAARATRVARQVLDILGRAHAHGVVHRDLKPENVFLREDGSVCLLDFGVAKLERRPEDAITRPGEFLGTPAYAAPEQIDDARRARPESDLFSAGVLLLEMLAGSTLAEKPRGTRARAGRALLVLAGVPEPVGRIVERALAEDPRRRFHRAAAMSAALGGTSLAGLVAWLLDRPTVVVGCELACVALVLGTLLFRAWGLEGRLTAERSELSERAERLAAEAEALRAENTRLREQREGPIRRLLYEDLRDRYRALLLADRVRGLRELPRFLAACESFLPQAAGGEARAAVEAMKTATAWRSVPRRAALKILRGRFADSWGDVPDTRVRVSINGREVAVSAAVDDSRTPEYRLAVDLVLGPFDTLAIQVEERDLEWEPLARVGPAPAGPGLDPVLALERAARGSPLEIECRWEEDAPALPEAP